MVEKNILEAYYFWNRRRVDYNSIVGIFTIFIVFTLAFVRNIEISLSFLILWTIIINGLFSLGFEFDCLIIRKSEGKNNLEKYRTILFWIGTIITVIMTLILGLTITI